MSRIRELAAALALLVGLALPSSFLATAVASAVADDAVANRRAEMALGASESAAQATAASARPGDTDLLPLGSTLVAALALLGAGVAWRRRGI